MHGLLKTDLISDQVLINKMIDTIQSQLASLNDQISRMCGKSATFDTLIKIARYEFQSSASFISYNDNSLICEGLKKEAEAVKGYMEKHFKHLL